MKSPVTMEIYGGKRTKIVHTNRLQHRYVPGQHDAAVPGNTESENDCLEWAPPSVIMSPSHLNRLCQTAIRKEKKTTGEVQAISLWSSLTGGGECNIVIMIIV